MLKHIDKIYTFLVTYNAKSFSKAAKTLNISQPAITQKIKQLEEFLNTTLIERKKNGIVLTKHGEYFLEIAKQLKECIDNTEIKIQHLKNENIPITIGATSSIAHYILPKYLSNIRDLLNKNINIITQDNLSLIESLEENKIDLIFTSKQVKNDYLDFIPLFKDEIVFFSNKPTSNYISLEELKNYNFICRENSSVIRQEVAKILNKYNFNCDNLKIKSYVDNSTTLKFTIMNANEQFVSMASLSTIEEEVKKKKLFVIRIKDIKMYRTIYIAYNKENKNKFITSAVKYIKDVTSS